MTAPPAIKRGTLRWSVLIWACAHPGEWTIETLAGGLGAEVLPVLRAVCCLRGRGLLAQSSRLRPTPTGAAAVEWVEE